MGVYHGNVAIGIVRFGEKCCGVGNRYKIYICVVVEQQCAAQYIFKFKLIQLAVNNFVVDEEVCGLKGCDAVNPSIDIGNFHSATFRYACRNSFPDGVEVLLGLQAVCIADMLEHIWLNGTLECSHFENLCLYTHFVEQFLEIWQLG